MKKIFLTLTAIILCTACVNFLFVPRADAAKNDKAAFEPRLLMAEVAGYGNIELKQGVTQMFYGILAETLQKNFNVESRNLVANIGGEPINNAEIFSVIHMDAIVHGAYQNYDTSGAKLKNYANSVLGRQKKGGKTDKKTENKAYRLNTSLAAEVKKIGAAYGVDYIFFCNVRDIEFWRRVGSSNLTTKNLEGKKVTIDLDYYLVEVKSGKVFAGKISDKRTNLNKSQISKTYGNKYTVDDMLAFALTEQALKIEKNILDKGLKSFSAK